MNYYYFKNFFYILLFSVFFTNLSAQNNQKLWSKVSKKEAVLGKKLIRKSEPSKAVHYQLDLNAMKSLLGNASKSNISKNASSSIIEIPNSEGGFDTFRVQESSILELEYQKKHPELRTYIGQNVNNPSSVISFSITSQGFHAMTLSSKTGTQFIDPYTNDNTYIIYNKGDLPSLKNDFECLVPDNPTLAKKISQISESIKNASDSKLRTFRLALACTIEYSKFHWEAAGLTAGDSESAKKAAVKAAMVVTMNRVNSIFQRDLAIKMILVDNTNIIFINSDNYTNDSGSTMLGENQSVIDNIIGSANYDIGHVFSTGGGGIATLESPCRNTVKARGVTGLRSPVGDVFDVEFVCHEMGHQFGAPHTFNGDSGNCTTSGNNPTRNPENAYEPGSGSTIMAYAGICTPQNVQQGGDPYFHQKSIQMMWDNITTGNSTCAELVLLNNNPPIADAGANYTIPISTPFKLTGNSTDPDGTSTHTYTWEQYDLGDAGLPFETNTTGPLFRSFEGTGNPIRNFPVFADYVTTGGSTTWEKLPSVNRTMTFALTVRDNDVTGENGGGQTDVDFMTVTVNSTDPFTVVNPFYWAKGSTQNIEWVVGQTANINTINCQNVNIKLSTDGGITFPITIASNIPNNGSFLYTVPEMSDTSQARILIEAADNIFYDVSDFDFSISTFSEPDFYIENVTLTPINCGDNTATYNFDFFIVNGFYETITFSVSGLPESATAVFSPSSLSDIGNVTMTISNLNGVLQSNYNITITGTAPSKVKDFNINFPFIYERCASTGNMAYQTSTTLVEFNTINQSSAKSSSYINYTSTPTNTTKNNTYDLSVRVNTDPDDGTYVTNTKVWIDWNQNCNFNDPGEEYDLGNAYNVFNGLTSRSPLSITIPSDAVLGTTIMRVSTKFSGDGLPTSCENNFDGEVEDYALNITSTLSAKDYEFDNLIVYPNPNKGSFTIKLNGSKSRYIQTEIYDVRGRAIFKNKYNINTNDFEENINLEGIESGLYLLIVSDGLNRYTKKIIVQ